MTTTIALTNLSKEITNIAPLVIAIKTQLVRDVAPRWGFDPTQLIVVGVDPSQLPNLQGAWIVTLQDGDSADALGEHTDDGLPAAVVYVDEILGYGGSLFEPGVDPSRSPAVSQVVSHECCEMLVNPYCSLWSPVSNPLAAEWQPTELCDRVQGFSGYDVEGVRVSDFLYPAAFLPGATGPYDQTGDLLGGVNAVGPGGYMTVLNSEGATSIVNDQRTDGGFWKLRKARITSRPALLAKAGLAVALSQGLQ